MQCVSSVVVACQATRNKNSEYSDERDCTTGGGKSKEKGKD